MQKKFLFFIIFSLLTSAFFGLAPAPQPVIGAADGPVWLAASPDLKTNAPQVELTQISPTAYQITMRFSGVWAEGVKSEDGAYSQLSLDTYGRLTNLGAPDLPIFTQQLETPQQVTPQLSIVHTKSTTVKLNDFGLPATLMPTQELASKSGPTPPWQPADAGIYSQNKLYPPNIASLQPSYQVRSRVIAPIQVSPVQYNPISGQLSLLEEITLTLSWKAPESTADLHSSAPSPVFDEIVDSLVLNPSQSALDEAKAPSGSGYLIITPAEYQAAMSGFVTIKENEGYDVTMTTLESIGSSTTSGIKAYIQTAYDTWTTPPTYLLLVGDTNHIPTWAEDETPACEEGQICFGEEDYREKTTDLYYGTMDGASDFVPDILIGRFPVRNAAQLTGLLNKYSNFAALDGSEAWSKKIAFAATSDQYTIAEATHNYVIDTYTEPLGYTGFFPNNPQAGGDQLYLITHSASEGDLKNAINDQRSMVIYSGHGSQSSWADFSFTSSDIATLSDNSALPFFAGFSCETNDIGSSSSDEVFGETMVLTANKAAVAYLGSADYSYWGPDDTFERSLFDNHFGTTYPPAIGASIFEGLSAVQSTYPTYSRYYWETYMLNGDPALFEVLRSFELSTPTNTYSQCKNSSQDISLTVKGNDGFSDPVTLSSVNLPTGTSISFAQNPVTPTTSTNMTVTTNDLASYSQTEVQINGSDGAETNSTKFFLEIYDQAAQFPILSSPSDHATIDTLLPTLDWEDVAQTQTYQLQVATDYGFSNLIVNKSDLTDSTYTFTSALESGITYYWRVRATNPCGTSAYSSIRQFTTPAAPGDCPAGYVTQTIYLDDFETVTTDWTTIANEGSNLWTRQTVRAQSPSNAYFVENLSTKSNQVLQSKSIPLPAAAISPTLQFWQWYEIENGTSVCFDGGLLKFKLNSNEWSFFDAEKIIVNPYDAPISDSYTNPLAGENAWCGSSSGWQKTVVDLNSFQGQDTQFQFQFGSDSSVGDEGWYVDDVKIQICVAPEAVFLPIITR